MVSDGVFTNFTKLYECDEIKSCYRMIYETDFVSIAAFICEQVL